MKEYEKAAKAAWWQSIVNLGLTDHGRSWNNLPEWTKEDWRLIAKAVIDSHISDMGD